MGKAIEYLKTLLKKGNDYTCFQARTRLSDIYRKGIYVKQDTTLANYLESGDILIQ